MEANKSINPLPFYILLYTIHLVMGGIKTNLNECLSARKAAARPWSLARARKPSVYCFCQNMNNRKLNYYIFQPFLHRYLTFSA